MVVPDFIDVKKVSTPDISSGIQSQESGKFFDTMGSSITLVNLNWVLPTHGSVGLTGNAFLNVVKALLDAQCHMSHSAVNNPPPLLI